MSARRSSSSRQSTPNKTSTTSRVYNDNNDVEDEVVYDDSANEGTAEANANANAADADADTTQALTPVQLVNQRFESINAKILELTGALKNLQGFVKTVHKECQKVAKTSSGKKSRADRQNAANGGAKKAPSGFAKPTELSPALCTFLDVPEGTHLARTDVTRRLNAYIKEHKLQAEEDKRNIQPDTNMKSILNMEEGDKLTFFNLQSYIKHNFVR